MDVYTVTGAGRGIGKAISSKLSSEGKFVLRIDRDFYDDEKSINGINYRLDLRNPDEIEKLFSYCESNDYFIKGIIHCAGICPVESISNITSDDMQNVYSINVFSFVTMCNYFFSYKKRCLDSRIIGISSITSDRAYKNQLLYSSSKAALNQISLSLAQEGIDKGVKVNVVQLGAVETEMFNSLNPNMQTIERHYPLGIMTSDEVANIITDLLTDKFAKMTGSIIKIDSGFGVVH